MKLVIFGLSVSSSWGNGHATLWRGLCRALAARGHRVVFFERDVPWYAAHRDLWELPDAELVLYPTWEENLLRARRELADADVSMVTSYCPDGIVATDLVLGSPGLHVFYELDTPVALDRLRSRKPVDYLGPRGLRDFDLVLSYTGGEALDALRTVLGARAVEPLYGSVDPELHRPVPPDSRFTADLSYLGTFADDRQETLERLFVAPARRVPEMRFRLGGAQYPAGFPWTENIFFSRHVAPADHPAFYCSSRITLNVTRGAMARMGYCPSGRLFEAAACGVPMLGDAWEGIEFFYEPGKEILIARDTEDVLSALSLPREQLDRIARAARERTLDMHTARHRAAELEALLETAASPTARLSQGD